MNSMWGKAIKRELFDSSTDYLQFKGLMHGEDLLQLLPVVDKANNMIVDDRVLYFYRRSENQSTAKYKKSQMEDLVKVISVLRDYGNKWKLTEQAGVCAIKNACYLLLILVRDINLTIHEKRSTFLSMDELSDSLRWAECCKKSLRIDYRLMIESLQNKRFYQAVFVSRFRRLLEMALRIE